MTYLFESGVSWTEYCDEGCGEKYKRGQETQHGELDSRTCLSLGCRGKKIVIATLVKSTREAARPNMVS